MRHWAKNMGVYCRPATTGIIRAGDAVQRAAAPSAIDH